MDVSLGLVVTDDPLNNEGVWGPFPLWPRPSLRLSATILILSYMVVQDQSGRSRESAYIFEIAV